MSRSIKRERLIWIAVLLIGISILLLMNRIAKTFYRTGHVYAYLNESVMFVFSQLFILFCVICGVKCIIDIFAHIRWGIFLRYKPFMYLCVIVILVHIVWVNAFTVFSIYNHLSLYPKIVEKPVYLHRSIIMLFQISIICPLLFILSARTWRIMGNWNSMAMFTFLCFFWVLLYAKNDLVPEMVGSNDIVWNLISDIVLYITYASCGYYYIYKGKAIGKKGFLGWIFATSAGVLAYEGYMVLNGKIRYLPDYAWADFSAMHSLQKECVLLIPLYIVVTIIVLLILTELYTRITVVSARIIAIGPLIIIIIRWVLSLCCLTFLPISNVFLDLPFYGNQAFYEMMLIAIIVGCCLVSEKKEAIVSGDQLDHS